MPRRSRVPQAKRPRNTMAAFKPSFDWIARTGMAYCVRHAGYPLARWYTTIAALTIHNEERHGRLEPDGDHLDRPRLEHLLRGLMVSEWLGSRKPVNTAVRGKTYQITGKKTGESRESTRRNVIGMQVLFRAVLAGEPWPEIPNLDLRALADRHPYIATITDYIYLDLSEADAAAVEGRLVEDAEFFERAWPLVRVREMGLAMEDFVDDDGSPRKMREFRKKRSPLYGFDVGSWRVEYPVSDGEIAALWEGFKSLRAKALARGRDPGAG